jgi:hypothetical protein
MTRTAKIRLANALHWVQLFVFAAIAAINGWQLAAYGVNVISTILLIFGIFGVAAVIASRFVSGGTWNARDLEQRLGQPERSDVDDT